MNPNPTITAWVKSSYTSGEGGNCVEWSPTYATAHGTVPVRDSKRPNGPTLMLTPTAWTGLVALALNSA
ncbi:MULTISPECIES: DUF397 domain-containing protein [unclassified Streptomyces]|uniref:DUF397 domain-containing protein n=1 Tax=unclassified Streptomyces TaxID=2593676 RepID=UPI00382CF0E6